MRGFAASRSTWLALALLIGVIVVFSSALHPFGPVKNSEREESMVRDLTMPPEVKAVIQRSCADCHSNGTSWPWYSYVAPTSWLVERDVRHGRDEVNFSHWSEYGVTEQEKLLAKIATVVKNHEMPLPQYTLIHRAAKLSEADTDILYQWARRERRKVRAELSAREYSKGGTSIAR